MESRRPDRDWCIPCNKPLEDCTCGSQPRADVNDRQVGGDHYKSEYQHWDFVIATHQNYLQGCATKYISRWRRKDGLIALEKSLHYIEKMEAAKMQKIPFDVFEVFRFAEANRLSATETAAIWAILAHEWKAARKWVEMIVNSANGRTLQPI